MPDTELLDRLRAGDSGAFDTIFRTCYAALVRAAEGIVHERAVAEELVQEAFLELWRRRERLTADGSPQAYLFRSVRNRALNELRHRRVVERSEPAALLETEPPRRADVQVMEGEIGDAVRRAIAELPPRRREVFELSRLHGLSYAEIAATLGITVKGVEAQMGKALKTLREQLAPWLPTGREL